MEMFRLSTRIRWTTSAATSYIRWVLFFALLSTVNATAGDESPEAVAVGASMVAAAGVAVAGAVATALSGAPADQDASASASASASSSSSSSSAPLLDPRSVLGWNITTDTTSEKVDHHESDWSIYNALTSTQGQGRHAVQAQCGMGKSTAIRKTYERLHNEGKIKYVVFVNCRVVQTIDNSSVNDAGNRYEATTDGYMRFSECRSWKWSSTINSLAQCTWPAEHTLLVLDEVTSICHSLGGKTMEGAARDPSVRRIEELMRDAKYIVAADADLLINTSARTFLRDPAFGDKEYTVSDFQFSDPERRRTIQLITKKNEFIKILHERIQRGANVFVASTSSQFVIEKVEKFCRDKGFTHACYTAEPQHAKKKDDFRNIDRSLHGIQVWAASAVMTVGVDPKEWKADYVMIYCGDKGGIPRDVFQGGWRAGRQGVGLEPGQLACAVIVTYAPVRLPRMPDYGVETVESTVEPPAGDAEPMIRWSLETDEGPAGTFECPLADLDRRLGFGSTWDEAYNLEFQHRRSMLRLKDRQNRMCRNRLHDVDGCERALDVPAFLMNARAAAHTEVNVRDDFFVGTFFRSVAHHRFHVMIGGPVDTQFPKDIHTNRPTTSRSKSLVDRVDERVKQTGIGKKEYKAERRKFTAAIQTVEAHLNDRTETGGSTALDDASDGKDGPVSTSRAPPSGDWLAAFNLFAAAVANHPENAPKPFLIHMAELAIKLDPSAKDELPHDLAMIKLNFGPAFRQRCLRVYTQEQLHELDAGDDDMPSNRYVFKQELTTTFQKLCSLLGFSSEEALDGQVIRLASKFMPYLTTPDKESKELYDLEAGARVSEFLGIDIGVGDDKGKAHGQQIADACVAVLKTVNTDPDKLSAHRKSKPYEQLRPLYELITLALGAVGLKLDIPESNRDKTKTGKTYSNRPNDLSRKWTVVRARIINPLAPTVGRMLVRLPGTEGDAPKYSVAKARVLLALQAEGFEDACDLDDGDIGDDEAPIEADSESDEGSSGSTEGSDSVAQPQAATDGFVGAASREAAQPSDDDLCCLHEYGDWQVLKDALPVMKANVTRLENETPSEFRSAKQLEKALRIAKARFRCANHILSVTNQGRQPKLTVVYGPSKKLQGLPEHRGRLYARGAGMQLLSRVLRAMVARRRYWDIDMVNAFLQLARQLDVVRENPEAYACLIRYTDSVEARNEVLEEIKATYQVGRKAAKTLPITFLHGGYFRSWVWNTKASRQMDPDRDAQPTPFLQALERECHALINAFAKSKVGKEYFELAKKRAGKKSGINQRWEQIVWAFSTYLHTLECSCLQSMQKTGNAEGWPIHTLIFDGGHLPRLEGKTEADVDDLLRLMEQRCLEETGYRIMLERKEFSDEGLPEPSGVKRPQAAAKAAPAEQRPGFFASNPDWWRMQQERAATAASKRTASPSESVRESKRARTDQDSDASDSDVGMDEDEE